MEGSSKVSLPEACQIVTRSTHKSAQLVQEVVVATVSIKPSRTNAGKSRGIGNGITRDRIVYEFVSPAQAGPWMTRFRRGRMDHVHASEITQCRITALPSARDMVIAILSLRLLLNCC